MFGREKNPGKNLSDSSAPPVQTGLFRSRPFTDPTVSDEVSPHQQELPDLQTQLERGARFNQSLSRMKVYGNKPAIQPKISVGAPGDKYEQEADQMADRVMSMPAAISHPPIQQLERQEEEKEPVQTKPLAASITPLVQRETAPAELEEEKEPLQMKRSLQRAAEGGSHDASSNLESQLSSSKGGGSPLPDEVRSFMEPRIGADFGSVRVHTDSEAVQMNQDLNAQAFTHGSDIYFGAGKYNPGSSDGKRLLAHELTHVVQQTGAVQRQEQQVVQRQVQLQGVCTEFGDFDIYPDDFVGPLPQSVRSARTWPIRKSSFDQLMARLRAVKAGTSKLTVIGTDVFKTATYLDLGWLMTSGVGQDLIQQLQNSAHTVTIQETSGGNSTAYNPDADSWEVPGTPPTAGPGANVTVNYNPNILQIGDGSQDWMTRPPAIGLAHELVHAWTGVYGTRARANDAAGVRRREQQATGIAEFLNSRISENRFRAAFGLPLRPVY